MGAPSKLRTVADRTEKLCTQCREWKAADHTHFSAFRDGVLKLHPFCRDCLRAYSRTRSERLGNRVRKRSWLPQDAAPRDRAGPKAFGATYVASLTNGYDEECRFKAYLLTNTVTRERYVGITERKLAARWMQHVTAGQTDGSGAFLHAAIRHYGVQAFRFEWIGCARSRTELNAFEQQLIRQYETVSHGYNQTRGGSAGESKGKAVEIDGKSFISLSAAARNYGIDEYTAHQRLRRYGWTLREALGLDRPPPRTKSGRTISVGGVTFKSIKAAAEAHGLSAGAVRARLDSGWTTEQALGLVPPPSHKATRTRPIEVDGRHVASVAEAASASGVPKGNVGSRLSRGWTIEQALGKECRAARKLSKANALVVGGTAYPSVRAACEARAKHYGVIQSRLHLGWSIEQAFDLAPPPPPSGRKNGSAVTVAGVTYTSRALAAKAHGVDPRQVHKRLRLDWTMDQAFGLEPRTAQPASDSAESPRKTTASS